VLILCKRVQCVFLAGCGSCVNVFNVFLLQGADLVEFDVHLTKDQEVIIYHDFKVNITYRKVHSLLTGWQHCKHKILHEWSLYIKKY